MKEKKMSRNLGFSKAAQQDEDVKSAFSMGLWTGGCLATFGCSVLVGTTLYYLGAFH